MKTLWAYLRSMRDSGHMRDLGLYAGFVLVATVFWCILALNEDAQVDLEVRLHIVGVPDSVTFITDPPASIHVNVRDRGTHLLRLRLMRDAELKLDFKEFAADGSLRVGQKALLTHLRTIFGQGAAVSLITTDSISVLYTSAPGKLVPVRVVTDITTALGKVVSDNPKSSVRQVKIFSQRGIIDTISYVTTEPVVQRGAEDSFTRRMKLRPIKGVRMEPSSVDVTITIQPLENRMAIVPINPINVPASESIVLFPEKVEVNYLVPMSKPDIPGSAFTVKADYRSIGSAADARMPLTLGPLPRGVQSATLGSDSVEFTIIRHVVPKR